MSIGLIIKGNKCIRVAFCRVCLMKIPIKYGPGRFPEYCAQHKRKKVTA